MTALLWWLAAALLLVLVGVWPPLAGYLGQFVMWAMGMLLAGAVQLLSQPELLLVVVLVYAVVKVRGFLRRLV